MAEAFTRAQVEAMSPDELTARIGELNAWAAAGAVDGQAAPDLQRPQDHQFTRAELEAMSLEEFEVNQAAIHEQLSKETIK